MTLTKTIAAFTAVVAAVSGSELTIRYYNEVGVPEKALSKAIETAAAALRRAEIPARWVNCYAKPTDCSTAAGVVLEVSIIGAPAEEFRKVASFAMGYSLLPEQGDGVYAKVIWNRVMKYSKAFDVPAPLVLGNAIAHEVGHLLLGTGDHAHAGIMKAQWSGMEKVALAGGRLGFQGHESAKMRRRLLVSGR